LPVPDEPAPLPRQEPRSEDIDILKPEPPPLPLPPKGPKSAAQVTSFIDSISSNDATFDLIVGQGRILTTRQDMTVGRNQPLVAVGDPSIVEFAVINARQIRVTGQRIGVTDLSVTTGDGQTFSFEIRVVADLGLLRGRLQALFPDANLKLGQIRDHVVVEGEARSNAQVADIIRTVTAYLESVRVGQGRRISGQRGQGLGGPLGTGMPSATPPGVPLPPVPDPNQLMPDNTGIPPAVASPELGGPVSIEGAIAPPEVINLIRVPGSQQVMLKVRVAELNRSALRQIGADLIGSVPEFGSLFGTRINGAIVSPATSLAGNGLRIVAGGASTPSNVLAGATDTVFGIFEKANFEFLLTALRRNSLLKILAEPNLVAMSGHQASFLAGGEFPIPVPQVGASGVAPTITVRFKEFGVRLGMVPYVLDDGIIRLAVAPEVSQIDFSIATTLVAGGSPVPGLNTRKAQTTVELRQGQTLAMAGLLQLTLDGTTSRVPGLGDLPVLGPFFSNTSSERIEKELVVLVTPYLIEPMNKGQVPPTPGDEVKEPNDLEFYLLNRIEGRTGNDFRGTTQWDDPWHILKHLDLERKYIQGPCGFSE
jgi:pilus assembly protein CpaC